MGEVLRSHAPLSLSTASRGALARVDPVPFIPAEPTILPLVRKHFDAVNLRLEMPLVIHHYHRQYYSSYFIIISNKIS